MFFDKVLHIKKRLTCNGGSMYFLTARIGYPESLMGSLILES